MVVTKRKVFGLEADVRFLKVLRKEGRKGFASCVCIGGSEGRRRKDVQELGNDS